MKSSIKFYLNAGNIILNTIAILITYFAFSYNLNGIQNYFLNSDSLYGIELLRDFLQSPTSIQNWLVPQATFVFPDFIFLLPGVAVGVTPYYIFLLALLLQTLTLIWLMRSVSRTLIPGVNSNYVDGLILITLLSGVVFTEPAKLLFSIEWHFGNAIGILLMIFLIFRNYHRRSIFTEALIIACSFFLGLSDSFFLLQFILPMLLIHFYSHLKRHASVLTNTLALLVAASSYLGYRSIKLFFWNSSREQIRFNIDEITIELPRLLKLGLETSNQLPIFIGMISIIFIPWVMIDRLGRKSFHPDAKPNLNNFEVNSMLYIAAHFRVSLFLSILVISLSNALLPAYRYFVYYLIFGFYWAGLLTYQALKSFSLGRYSTKFKFDSRLLLILYSLVLSLAFFSTNFANAKVVPPPTNTTIRCLDDQISANNLTRGAASYWLARYHSNFLKSKPEVVAVLGNLEAYLWITNWRDYEGEFDFALIQNDLSQDPFHLTSEVVKSISGMNSSYDCGEITIVYGGSFFVRLPGGF